MNKRSEKGLPLWTRYPIGGIAVLVTGVLAFKILPSFGVDKGEVFIAFLISIVIFGYAVVWKPIVFIRLLPGIYKNPKQEDKNVS